MHVVWSDVWPEGGVGICCGSDRQQLNNSLNIAY